MRYELSDDEWIAIKNYGDTLHITRLRCSTVHSGEKITRTLRHSGLSYRFPSPQAALHEIFEPRDEVIRAERASRRFAPRAARRVA